MTQQLFPELCIHNNGYEYEVMQILNSDIIYKIETKSEM